MRSSALTACFAVLCLYCFACLLFAVCLAVCLRLACDPRAQGAAHLRAVFYRMGFTDRDIVALSGGHTLGRCHSVSARFRFALTSSVQSIFEHLCGGIRSEPSRCRRLTMCVLSRACVACVGQVRSGFDGPWTDGILAFNNDYFKNLMFLEWEPRRWTGPAQFANKVKRSACGAHVIVAREGRMTRRRRGNGAETAFLGAIAERQPRHAVAHVETIKAPLRRYWHTSCTQSGSAEEVALNALSSAASPLLTPGCLSFSLLLHIFLSLTHTPLGARRATVG